MNINKLLILGAAIFSIHAVSAGDIHQWRDKDGRLHFGDQQNAPSGSKVILNSPKTDDSQANPAEADKGNQGKNPGTASAQASHPPGYSRMNDAPYEKGAPAGMAPEKLAQCTGMVREHFSHENSPGEIRAFFVKLESVCPKTGFICKSYKLSPQKNLCEPVQYKDGKNQVSHQEYNS
ncbi:DUF4124 domain-containing protein [Undibacterium sp. JH2W]|uniref:DUF4124 domain-containing protein n=1 Tax=Undibacterium sp. JH2W TaxID=3413037 RepID=UPI003BF2F76C